MPLGLSLILIILSDLSAKSQDIVELYFKNEIELAEYIVMPEVLLHKIMADHTDFVLYDIRLKTEFDTKHIVGAVNLPWENMAFQNKIDSIPGDREIYIISGDGTLSFDAVRLLIKNGFSRVYCIEGGMDNWLYKDLLL